MAYVAGNRTSTVSFGTRITEMGAHAVEAYRNWRVYRNTLNELSDMSAREMADLGINPTMIRRIALEAAYGKTA
ncbi:DUF1127 domain-containing protein [Hasllibacter sp. MH4015]|uniref:DUF1127 domain-containing protein n=1 Tax=Hasllibacter sp. MH4015 TaxID=2854029 RepID=UPI001CD76253|nr:DUF1127 domain-containing protein [Hasllibacter sp. MH4015]